MLTGFIAKKKTMSNRYLDNNRRIGVTMLECPALTVTQTKLEDKDGYQAIQFAYGQSKRLDAAQTAKVKKLGLDFNPASYIEFKQTSDAEIKIGDKVTVDQVLNVGDTIKVTGTTKGRGFAGVIKRHGFHRQPVTGGQSDRVRAPGSIGAQTPGKVLKGKKMPGHYGNATMSVTGLKVIAIDTENNRLIVSGSVPGSINSWIKIEKAK